MQSSHYTKNYTIENVGVTFDQTRSNQVVESIDPLYVSSVIRLYWRWESDFSFVSYRAAPFTAYGDSNGSTKHLIKNGKYILYKCSTFQPQQAKRQ
jgi:hypothetical protein